MLQLQNMSVKGKNGKNLLDQVSFAIKPGEILGLTGQSGAGKSTVLKSIMGILPDGLSRSGQITLNDERLDLLAPSQWRKRCGTVIGFIPQNPMTAFDSRFTIGRQMTAMFRTKSGLSKKEAVELSLCKLEEVNLREVNRVFQSYPNELSGGMLQRAAAAVLLGLSPQYVLADEPTSALDEENRDQILEILKKYSQKAGILLVSHDPDDLMKLCRNTMLIENGSIVDNRSMGELLNRPKTLWTRRFTQAYRKSDKEEWIWTAL